MRIVRHPNIVQLKAFYYSNGERVSFPAHVLHVDPRSLRPAEGRGVPESGAGIRPGDRLPGV